MQPYSKNWIRLLFVLSVFILGSHKETTAASIGGPLKLLSCGRIFSALRAFKVQNHSQLSDFGPNFSFDETAHITELIAQRYPSSEYVVIGPGRSPFAIVHMLNLMKKNYAKSIAISYRKETAILKAMGVQDDFIKVFGAYSENIEFRQALFDYFDQNLGTFLADSTKKVVLVDFESTGRSLGEFRKDIEAYLKYKGIEKKVEELSLRGSDFVTVEDTMDNLNHFMNGQIIKSDQSGRSILALRPAFIRTAKVFAKSELEVYAPYKTLHPSKRTTPIFKVRENNVLNALFTQALDAEVIKKNWPIEAIADRRFTELASKRKFQLSTPAYSTTAKHIQYSLNTPALKMSLKKTPMGPKGFTKDDFKDFMFQYDPRAAHKTLKELLGDKPLSFGLKDVHQPYAGPTNFAESSLHFYLATNNTGHFRFNVTISLETGEITITPIIHDRNLSTVLKQYQKQRGIKERQSEKGLWTTIEND